MRLLGFFGDPFPCVITPPRFGRCGHFASKWKPTSFGAPRIRAALVVYGVLMFAVTAPGICLAQDSLFTADPAWFSGPTSLTRSVALGDVDGDGDLDLVDGNENRSNSLYLNTGGTFSTLPAWSSGPTNSTQSVALGDVDGDGDLDLVCGNNGQSNTLYLNTGGTFSTLAVWSSGPVNGTFSVALGDVDGDGDLDLVCGNFGQSNTLYLNTAGTFSTQPAWSSGPVNGTFSVALGDVDGDGDIDLVCGNSNQSNTLYLNTGGTFSALPAWSSVPANDTRSVALGDVDGNGALDLVCGNLGSSSLSAQSNTLYLNTGGILSTLPGWSSGLANLTYDVALGDVDGDGDLDLVCGNLSRSNTLYLNTGGTFSTLPAWSSGPANATQSVALGDVDGDGDLDLVCGNSDRSNTVYLNTGGTLSTLPAWSSGLANHTSSVALGDVDGDGDLDLVCGNAFQSNTLYLNTGGTLSTLPAWSSGLANHTSSVALGDVDGDGDLDLVCGNSGSNTLYLNTGGTFSTLPDWSSDPMNSTRSVALGDVDRDGDLDLICGNQLQSNTFYLNTGGTFSALPDWSSDPMNSTQSVALGDVDRDGDLDLVCGNQPQSNTLYLNTGGTFSALPDWSSDPMNSTQSVALGDVDGDGDLDLVCGNRDQLNTLYLNTGGTLSKVPAWSSGLRNNTLSVTLGDVDGDLDLVCGIASLGARAQSNTLYEGKKDPVFKGDPLLPTNHLPNNSAHLRFARLVWPDVNIIRIHFSAIDVESDPVSILPEYQFEGNPTWFPVEVGSGSLGPFSTSPGGVSDSLDWDIFNVPFDSRNVFLRLRTIEIPRRVSFIQHVASYIKKVGTVAPGRSEITVSSEILSFPTVKAGRTTFVDLAVENSGTVDLTVTNIEIPSSEITLSRSIPFTLVPGEKDTLRFVLTPLLELDISDSIRIHSSDPLTPVKVLAITTDILRISTTAIENRGPEFAEGRDITILVSLPTGATFVGGALHFRRGGEESYQVDSLLQTGNLPPRAAVPGIIAGPRGVQYWVEAETIIGTRRDTLTDPPVLPDEQPRSIRVTVDGLDFPYTLPAERYRMIAMGLEMDGTILGTFNELGGVDNTKWRMWGYDTMNQAYQELPDSSIFEFEHGRGYWLITRSGGVRLNTGPTKGRSTPTDSMYVITLQKGHNLIGNPFNFPVAWDSMMVDALTVAEAESALVEPPVGFAAGYQFDVRILEPFDGYWVKNLTNSPVTLKIPPVEALLLTAPRPQPSDGWRIAIGATSAGAHDASNIAGVSDGASTAWDYCDRSEPPMTPGQALSLYFPHSDWERHPAPYAFDIRGAPEAVANKVAPIDGLDLELWGYVWRFDVAKNFSVETAGDEVVLDFGDIESVPADAKVLLVDHDLDRLIDLKKEHTYRYFQGVRAVVQSENDARFALIVGSDEFIAKRDDLPALPTRTVLHQNYPNPFNPTTIIRYEIARAGDVTLRIYNAAGALVKELYSGPRVPGIYEASWNGDNAQGQKVASGIYFYKLSAVDFTQTKKMILLK